MNKTHSPLKRKSPSHHRSHHGKSSRKSPSKSEYHSRRSYSEPHPKTSKKIRRRDSSPNSDFEPAPPKKQKTKKTPPADTSSSSSSSPSSNSEHNAGEYTPIVDYEIPEYTSPHLNQRFDFDEKSSRTSDASSFGSAPLTRSVAGVFTHGVVESDDDDDFDPIDPAVTFTPQQSMGSAASASSIVGRRESNEDSYVFHEIQLRDADGKKKKGDYMSAFFGVFDGHGGKRASAFVAKELYEAIVRQENFFSDPEQAIKTGFQKVNDSFLKIADRMNWDDGTTAIVAILINKTCYIANVGDCRAVLVQNEVDVEQDNFVVLSKDHKADCREEAALVEGRGGTVVDHMGCNRVCGILAVSRAIGDRKVADYITSEPEIIKRKLNSDDVRLVLATDGLWDVADNYDVADWVRDAQSTDAAANELCDKAFKAGSCDNVTAVVIDMQKFNVLLCVQI